MNDTNSSFDPNRPKIEIDIKNDRRWAMFSHLSALILFLGVPFGNILGPWIIWLIKKNEMFLVDQEGRKALNFQLSMTLYALIIFMLFFVFFGFVLFAFALILMELIITIMAAVKTYRGKDFQYPLSIKIFPVSS